MKRHRSPSFYQKLMLFSFYTAFLQMSIGIFLPSKKGSPLKKPALFRHIPYFLILRLRDS
jgi:hypothetical protein